MTEVDRFWSHVAIVALPGGCWVWTGQLDNDGYGRFKTIERPGTSRTMRAHRWAYQHFYGPIPAGLTVDHLCGRRACVRPDHLEAVTHAENLGRRHARRRPEQHEGSNPYDRGNH